MTSPIFLQLKTIFEHGDIYDYIFEYEKLFNNFLLGSLPRTEQLRALLYLTNIFVISDRHQEIKVWFFKNSHLCESKLNLPKIDLALINLIKLKSFPYKIFDNDDRAELYNKTDELISSLSDNDRTQNSEIICFYLENKAYFYAFSDNFNKTIAFETINKAFELIDESQPSYIQCLVFQVSGILNLKFNDTQKGITQLRKAIEIAEKIHAKERMVVALVNLSEALNIESDYKNLDESIELINKAIEINKLVRRPSHSKNDLARIYLMKGEIDKALAIAKEALVEFEELQAERHKIGALEIIGEIIYQQGDIEKARLIFEEALRLNKRDTGFNLELILDCLLMLCQIAVSERNSTLSNHYLQEINLVLQHNYASDFKIYSTFAEALYLKNSKRVKNLAKSQEMFRDIINNSINLTKFKALAINNLSEMILDEFNLLGDEESLAEIDNLIKLLFELGQKSQNYPIIIQSLIIQARLKVIDDLIPDALEILEKGKILASERNLIGLKDKIEQEKLILIETIQNSLSKLNDKKNRLDYIELGTYIQQAQRIAFKEK